MVMTFLAFGSAGCSSEPGKTAPSYEAFQPLEDIATMLKAHQDQKNRPPAKRQDLNAFEPIAPIGFHDLMNDQCILVYGVPITTEPSDVILAYQKDVPVSGGFVLLQDARVKKMTAAEFAAAPKAGKK